MEEANAQAWALANSARDIEDAAREVVVTNTKKERNRGARLKVCLKPYTPEEMEEHGIEDGEQVSQSKGFYPC